MIFEKVYPVTCSTHHVGQGTTFVAINGHRFDGRSFIPQAIEKGATTIVVDDVTDVEIPDGIRLEVVDNARSALSKLAAQAHGNPSEKLTVIGVTGTAGKTTTAYIIQHLLKSAGIKTALLTGIENNIGTSSEKSTMTTQSADYLHAFFAQCVKQGATHVVMEVSSHALAYSRVDHVSFAGCVFTNFSAEHLDFHLTLNDYFDAKMKLLSLVKPNGFCVVSPGNEWNEKACKRAGEYGLKLLTSTDLEQFELPQTLPGSFNRLNAQAALQVAQQCGISPEICRKALRSMPVIPGRMQFHCLKNGARAVVDYAHKSGALHAVLSYLRLQTDHLIVMFGCGGNKDKSKRPVMGSIAAEYADHIILTNDNPRTEDPITIIHEIMSGIPEKSEKMVSCVPDRKRAIAHAVALSDKNSIIALLGKGHEITINDGGRIVECDDLAQVRAY